MQSASTTVVPPHRLTIVVVLVTTVLAGEALPAAQKRAKVTTKASAEAAPQLTWPLPPEHPRIRYVTSYRGADDFKPAKKPSKLMRALLGSPDSDRSTDAMLKPYGVAFSPTGRLYVADTAARRVFAFDTETKTLAFVGEEGAGRLAKPIGVAVDDRGTVFVADATAKRVFGYAGDGRLAIAIGRDGEFTNPSGLALDRARQRIYVADAAQHQILSYSSGDGAHIRTIGRRGAEPGEFNFPTNLAVDTRGRLYVADTLNFRVQIFDTEGTFVKQFGTLGDCPGCLNRPKGIGVDSEGHIYVVDASFNNFQIFDEDGQLLLFVGAGGMRPGEFSLPSGLFIDGQDRIYIADSGNSRVQVFQYVRGAEK